MTLAHAIFLGVIQALTEFLPVSSSGHLVVFQQFMEVHEATPAYDALLHGGTALATIIFFHRAIRNLILGSWNWGLSRLSTSRQASSEDSEAIRLALLILLSSVVTAALALPLKDLFESLFDQPLAVGVAFLVTAAWLWLTRKHQAGREDAGLTRITLTMAIVIGLAQFVAVTPGISRSGATIGTALLLGLQRKKAAEFSFLISIPAICGANLIQFFEGQLLSGPLTVLAGFTSAFLAGLFALWLLVLLVRRGNFYQFSFYLAPLGAVVILASLAGWL
jgi:undecaprenyl-diphosphatase